MVHRMPPPLPRAQICAIISHDIQPVGNLRVLKHVASLLPADADAAAKEAAKGDWARRYMVLGFEAVEAVLAEHSGRYCVGDAVTLADAFLVPQVYNAHRFKVDMAPYPNIARVAAALEALPAFAAAHPSKQPDAE
jgi:maleylacetoacetate isomerase